MAQAVIVSAVRTPVGKFGGSLTGIHATDLCALVISEALKRAGIKGELVDEVLMGNVLMAGLGQNPARTYGSQCHRFGRQGNEGSGELHASGGSGRHPWCRRRRIPGGG